MLAAGISAKSGVGNSLHFALYVEIDFGCALGIERTNADAADIVDMEPRMPYMRKYKRKTKYSATILEGLQQAAVLSETASTRKLVQAYLQARRSKAEVRHGKSAGRLHGRDRRTCMPDGQWIDSLTGKPWMAANVEEAEAQVEAAAVAEHLKEECMESMRRVMKSVEGVFAAERANQEREPQRWVECEICTGHHTSARHDSSGAQNGRCGRGHLVAIHRRGE